MVLSDRGWPEFTAPGAKIFTRLRRGLLPITPVCFVEFVSPFVGETSESLGFTTVIENTSLGQLGSASLCHFFFSIVLFTQCQTQ